MPNSKPPDSKLIMAAGAVAWRPGRDGGEPEVLLVHRTKYDDWSLPKGKAEQGEPLPVAAFREVFEEGGTRLALGRRLASVRYHVSGRPKRVHYWSARVTGIEAGAVPNTEVDQVSWLPSALARERVTYARDISILDDFDRLPFDTTPLILLRHAKAVAKPGWHGDDAARPLDEPGRADAKALACLLACFAPAARVVSSPALRCLDTVRPYAELVGGTVRAAPQLSAPSSRTDGGASADRLIMDAVAAGTPAVFCAHRENMPDLITAALTAFGPPCQGLPAGWDATLPTSGFVVMHSAGGALVAADRYDLSDT